MQYFSRFKQGFASHGKRQNIYVLVLRVKTAKYVFYLINKHIMYLYLADPGKARGCSTNASVIN